MVLKNKNILNLLIFTILILLGISSYYAYHSYQKYIIVKNHTKLSSFVYEVESILGKIALERIDTAKYLGTKKKSSLLKVKQRRKAVDSALSSMENFVTLNSQYMIFHTHINEVREGLKEIRNEVENLNEIYSDIFLRA